MIPPKSSEYMTKIYYLAAKCDCIQFEQTDENILDKQYIYHA